jgi:hypothetical protein
MHSDTGLTGRERELVDVLAALGREFGISATYTTDALMHITGDQWAGSLAGLVMAGYATQEKSPEDQGIGYRLSEKGWALFAGIDESLAEPEEPIV